MQEIRSLEELGPLLRAARRAAHLRQEDVAMAAGCSTKFVVDLEGGKVTAPLSKAFAVIEAMGGRISVAFPA